MEKEKTDSLEFNYDSSWVLKPITKHTGLTAFIRNLPVLFDEDCILVLSDVLAADILDFLAEKQPECRCTISSISGSEGKNRTFLLKLLPPFVERVRYASSALMQMKISDVRQLADLAENYAEPEVCTHLAVYKDNIVLMIYHDVCCGGYPFISGDINEDKVKAFSEAVGFKYSRYNYED